MYLFDISERLLLSKQGTYILPICKDLNRKISEMKNNPVGYCSSVKHKSFQSAKTLADLQDLLRLRFMQVLPVTYCLHTQTLWDDWEYSMDFVTRLDL